MEGKFHIRAQLRSFRGSNRAVDAHNGGLEARNEALEGPVVPDFHHFDEELKHKRWMTNPCPIQGNYSRAYLILPDSLFNYLPYLTTLSICTVLSNILMFLSSYHNSLSHHNRAAFKSCSPNLVMRFRIK
jgi:hypothetical protein